MDFEVFHPDPNKDLAYADERKGGPPPFDPVDVQNSDNLEVKQFVS
ncbi:hypothetical protein AmDm5_1492 [Acetobacter malorum]|nr:hypothetical protein AmDm5_1492 [Acetobacter malorum]